MSDSPAARKRGRPATETPQERLARLEKEIAAAREAVRESERRRFAIIGEAVAAEMDENPAFRTTIAEVLARRVTSPQAKADIAPLLVAAPA
jgi:hypothetical protein